MTEYNYASFPLDMCDGDFRSFPQALKVGEPSPDGTLVDASDGTAVRLSDYWSRGALVIEFGSVT